MKVNVGVRLNAPTCMEREQQIALQFIRTHLLKLSAGEALPTYDDEHACFMLDIKDNSGLTRRRLADGDDEVYKAHLQTAKDIERLSVCAAVNQGGEQLSIFGEMA